MTYAATTRFRRRWGDNDRHLGPYVTWALEKRGGHGIGLMLDSGDDEHPGCHVRFYLTSLTVLIELPHIIQPKRKKVFPNWDAETVARLGRDYYYDEHPREYGFNFSGNALLVHYGAQTLSWSGCASKCYFLPWLSWRFIRHTHYTPSGERIRTFWEDALRRDRRRARRLGEQDWRTDDLDYARALPTMDFLFRDFDGEEIVCKTRIDEREWRFGTGWCSWLSLFVPAKVRRTADLQFTKETGRRKGSWKGGTLGHGIDMEVGEPLESAFRRYCRENQMTFVGPVPVHETGTSTSSPANKP